MKDIQKLKEYFSHSNHPILLAYLFGSQATGLSHSESDYDIAVLLKDVGFDKQMKVYRRILFEIGGVSGEKEIDLLLLNGDETELACKSACFGNLLYSADEKVRVDYQTRMLSRYFELKDFKRTHQYYLRKRVLSRRMGEGEISMIDSEAINQRIDHIQRMLARLKAYRVLTLEEFERDENRYHAALYQLQTSIEAVSDIANHLHAALNLKPALRRAEVLIILAEAGVISKPLAERLSEAVEMKNIIVHGYLSVALRPVYDVIQNDLGHIEEFCREVLLYM